jgi:hypothetical protein
LGIHGGNESETQEIRKLAKRKVLEKPISILLKPTDGNLAADSTPSFPDFLSFR